MISDRTFFDSLWLYSKQEAPSSLYSCASIRKLYGLFLMDHAPLPPQRILRDTFCTISNNTLRDVFCARFEYLIHWFPIKSTLRVSQTTRLLSVTFERLLFKAINSVYNRFSNNSQTQYYTHLSLILALVDLHHDSKAYSACVTRENNFGLSLFRSGRRSNIPTSGEDRFKYPLPREGKISQMSHPRDNNHNQIPTPCPASPSPPPAYATVCAVYLECTKPYKNNISSV